MNVFESEPSEGDELEVNVAAKAPSGEGICRVNNFIIFIRNKKTKVGSTYKVKIVKKHRTFAYADLINLSDVESIYAD